MSLPILVTEKHRKTAVRFIFRETDEECFFHFMEVSHLPDVLSGFTAAALNIQICFYMKRCWMSWIMYIKSILSFLLLFLCHLLLSVDCVFKARDIPKSLLFKMSSVPEGWIARDKSVVLSALVESYFEFCVMNGPVTTCRVVRLL